jgi:CRISPR system Cascade subunit CasD
MPTLLLRCAAPLQSWGTQSDYSIRDTGREPSKSGIIGLLCAALGRPRAADVGDLAALRMGARVDQEGKVLREWQTAQRSPQDTTISNRYFLMDATFVVGLESPDAGLLTTLHQALRNPVWHLCLGRKSCPPSLPPYLKDGLRAEDLSVALQSYPWQGFAPATGAPPTHLRVVLDDPAGVELRRDLPISFAARAFHLRRVRTDFIPLPPAQAELDPHQEAPCTWRV